MNATRTRIVAFGEALLRLSPAANRVLATATSMEVHPGGAELNTMVALALAGHQTRWISSLPESDLSDLITSFARSRGVEVDVRWVAGGRVGVYYAEIGSHPRPTRVIYDRSDSSFSTLQAGNIDWEACLVDTGWAHVTGVTPALGQGPSQLARELIMQARRAGVGVSFDFNYRSSLWSIDAARQWYRQILPHVDILFASKFDLHTFCGFSGDSASAARQCVEEYGISRVVLCEKQFWRPGSVQVRVTSTGPDTFVSSNAHSAEVRDPIGAGDALAAGYLHGRLCEQTESTAVEYAARACALKYSLSGDSLSVWLRDLPETDRARGVLR